MSERAAWVALSLLRGMGGRTLRNLLAAFDGDLAAILAADEAALRQVSGIGPKIAAGIRRIDVDAAARRLARWESAGVAALIWDDDDYPGPLRELDDAPPTLFARGVWPASSADMSRMALVGTRRPSPAAQTAARALTAALIDRGATIVSGLALGIDSLAHHEALAGSGRTLAVLGGGVLNVYPPQHAHLADAISARGALLCEVAPDAAVGSPGLVARNRIITGLAECVFIVESQTDGGAMHAGRFAREQGRRLFTLDLPASGNRALIAAGAVALPVDADALVDRLDGVLDTPG